MGIKLNTNQLQKTAWGLSTSVALLAIFRWGQLYQWQIDSSYQWFPLFGLLAFSLMWSHYIMRVIRQMSGIDRLALKTYFEVTSFIVLASILIHPGLLAWSLWRDGLGLPLGSYFNYIGPALKLYILMAETALLIFLAYELRRWFSKKKWWPLVAHLSDLAMILILLHSLKLGSHLQHGWFRGVWYFYGASYFVALGYIYYHKYRASLVK